MDSRYVSPIRGRHTFVTIATRSCVDHGLSYQLSSNPFQSPSIWFWLHGINAVRVAQISTCVFSQCANCMCLHEIRWPGNANSFRPAIRWKCSANAIELLWKWLGMLLKPLQIAFEIFSRNTNWWNLSTDDANHANVTCQPSNILWTKFHFIFFKIHSFWKRTKI